MRTFSVCGYVGCPSNSSSIFGIMSMPRHCALTYHVWWLMPAATMSTSLRCSVSSCPIRPSRFAQCSMQRVICQWPPWTPWHRPTVRTPPYSLQAQVFIAIGLE